MQVFRFSHSDATPIQKYESSGAAALPIASGHGDTHVNYVQFEPGGVIGPHPTGFAQLFIVSQGSGWVAGEDGVRTPISTGQYAYYRKGELHSKGTDKGMAAIMVQVDSLNPSRT